MQHAIAQATAHQFTSFTVPTTAVTTLRGHIRFSNLFLIGHAWWPTVVLTILTITSFWATAAESTQMSTSQPKLDF